MSPGVKAALVVLAAVLLQIGIDLGNAKTLDAETIRHSVGAGFTTLYGVLMMSPLARAVMPRKQDPPQE